MSYQEDRFTEIANAIRLKSGTTDTIVANNFADRILALPSGVDVIPLSITANGTYTAPSGKAYSPIEVDVSGGGGVSRFHDDITFYDYDGTVVYSFPLSALPLAELPPLPMHDGLQGQEWNHTLEQVNACTYKLDVGATYTTSDGATRIYVEHGNRTDIRIQFAQSIASGVTIHWGDGTTETKSSTASTQIPHVYTDGLTKHTVSLYPIENCTITLSGSPSSNIMGNISGANAGYSSMLKRVEIGDRCIVGQYAFVNARAFSHCSISKDTTSFGLASFNGCNALVGCVIPNGTTTINQSLFSTCYSLRNVCLPQSITSIGSSTFNKCYAISRFILPPNITSITSSLFNTCYALEELVIPNGVTSIESYAFSSCSALSEVVIPNGVTKMDLYAFNACYSLKKADIPPSVNNMGSTLFSACYSLQNAVIPNGVTVINVNLFSSCYSLTKIKIPSSVNTINATAFNSCYAIVEYDFSEATSVPALANVNAFSNIASDCKILVPSALYDEWISTTNWSTYMSYIVPV